MPNKLIPITLALTLPGQQTAQAQAALSFLSPFTEGLPPPFCPFNSFVCCSAAMSHPKHTAPDTNTTMWIMSSLFQQPRGARPCVRVSPGDPSGSSSVATERTAAVMAQAILCALPSGGSGSRGIHCWLEEGKLFPSKADDRPLLGFFQRKTLPC